MRTEDEITRLILQFAEERDDVRAVVLSGSRADPHAERDWLQDFDITYVVNDIVPYRGNASIAGYFGDIMILQRPNEMTGAVADRDSDAYLMQFVDGWRIDLTFLTAARKERIRAESLSVVLLDKDGDLRLPPPSLESYAPKRPTKKEFDDCCNEYWWLNPYAAKGLYRGQIPYAKQIMDALMRRQLMDMLEWYAGTKTDFQVGIGYLGKHLQKRMETDMWQLWMESYSDGRTGGIWTALSAMNELFRRTARTVARALGYAYPEREDEGVSAFVQQIRTRPQERKSAIQTGRKEWRR